MAVSETAERSWRWPRRIWEDLLFRLSCRLPDRFTVRELRLVLRALVPYALFGILWVVLSDRIAGAVLATDYQLSVWHTYKGWMFVVVSLFLIYILVRGEQVARVRSEQKFAAAFATTPDPMAILRLHDGAVMEVNQGFTWQLGYEKSEVQGRKADEAGLWADRRTRSKFWDALREKGVVQSFEANLRTKDDRVRTVLLSARIARIDRRDYAVVVAKDITERENFRARVEQQALRDPLTGLPSRSLLIDRLTQELARAERRDRRVAVLSINLDRFRVINETLGFGAGDRLLAAVGRRLSEALRKEDTVARVWELIGESGTETVARIGADEFNVILGEIEALEDALVAMERLQRTIRAPFFLDGQEVGITASFGLALSAEDDPRPERLLRHAAIAMRRAKEKGLGQYHVFDPGVDSRAEHRLQLESELRGAVERDELELRFMPVVSLVTGRIVGFESLLRWAHPERGILSPLEVLPVAEESGLIGPVGMWVLEETCRIGKRWRELHRERFPDRPPLLAAMNISGKELGQPGFADRVAEKIRGSGVDPEAIVLEITETTLIHSIPTLHNLHVAGVRVAVDDFGPGYSAPAYLGRLPIDIIKIDPSFVAGFGTIGEITDTVRALVAMGRSLRLDVVAEGIETEAQLERFRKLGCTYAQGYLFARPLTREAAEALLLEDSRW